MLVVILIPPLQVGGVHEAITAPAPAAGAEAVPTLPKTVLVAPEAPTDAGFEVLQVRGTPVSGLDPRLLSLSSTVAFNVVEAPVFTTKKVFVAGFPAALIEIDCTRQVSTAKGWLLRPLAEAKTCPNPGVLAVTIC